MTNEKNIINQEVTGRLLRAFRELYVRNEVSGKADFCKSIGLSPQGFSAIENGRQYCSIQHAYNLAKIHNISLNWLFFEEGNPFVA